MRVFRFVHNVISACTQFVRPSWEAEGPIACTWSPSFITRAAFVGARRAGGGSRLPRSCGSRFAESGRSQGGRLRCSSAQACGLHVRFVRFMWP